MAIWYAEKTVTTGLASRLIQSQFSQLCPLSIQLIGEGWDNVAYEINHQFVFRFPRRQLVVELIELEFRVLPKISSFFRSACGLEIKDSHWKAAKFRALSHSAYVAIYSHEIQDKDLLHESLKLLQFLSEEVN